DRLHVAVGESEVDPGRMPAAIPPDRAARGAEDRIPAVAAWVVFLVVVHAAAEAGADRRLRARHPRYHIIGSRLAAAAETLAEKERVARAVLYGQFSQSGFGAVRENPLVTCKRIIRRRGETEPAAAAGTREVIRPPHIVDAARIRDDEETGIESIPV